MYPNVTAVSARQLTDLAGGVQSSILTDNRYMAGRTCVVGSSLKGQSERRSARCRPPTKEPHPDWGSKDWAVLSLQVE